MEKYLTPKLSYLIVIITREEKRVAKVMATYEHPVQAGTDIHTTTTFRVCLTLLTHPCSIRKMQSYAKQSVIQDTKLWRIVLQLMYNRTPPW